MAGLLSGLDQFGLTGLEDMNLYEKPKKAEVGEDGKEAKAREYKHMTMYEAAELAKRAEVKQMWLTHYSPSLVHPEQYESKVKKIFANTVISRDGRSCELMFEEN